MSFALIITSHSTDMSHAVWIQFFDKVPPPLHDNWSSLTALLTRNVNIVICCQRIAARLAQVSPRGSVQQPNPAHVAFRKQFPLVLPGIEAFIQYLTIRSKMGNQETGESLHQQSLRSCWDCQRFWIWEGTSSAWPYWARRTVLANATHARPLWFFDQPCP